MLGKLGFSLSIEEAGLFGFPEQFYEKFSLRFQRFVHHRSHWANPGHVFAPPESSNPALEGYCSQGNRWRWVPVDRPHPEPPASMPVTILN
jgi:hypothetical protein